MNIIGIGIDERLIHGQVADLWATKLGTSGIMVVGDEVTENAIERSGPKLTAPAGVKPDVLLVKKAAQNTLVEKYDSQRLLTVIRKLDRLLEPVELGVPIKEINAGNMSQTNETWSVIESINVVDQDIEVSKELNAKGAHLATQTVPNDKAEDFISLVTK